jgi:hypothetical protein
MKDDEITLLKLIDGSTVVCGELTVSNTNAYNTKTYTLKDAYLIIAIGDPTDPNSKGGIMFMPILAPYSEITDCEIKEEHVLTKVPPRPEIRNAFKQYTGKGVVTPSLVT